MRNLVIYLVFACLVGCASDRYYVRTDGRKSIALEESYTAYVTDYEELRALRASNLEYMGTKDGYHIVYWWIKILPGPSAVSVFAVPESQFIPARPFRYERIQPHTPSQNLFPLMLRYPDRTLADWQLDKAIAEAERDLAAGTPKIYISGTIASFAPGIDSGHYHLVRGLPNADAGIGCRIPAQDVELRTAQFEYARRYNEFVVQQLSKQ